MQARCYVAGPSGPPVNRPTGGGATLGEKTQARRREPAGLRHREELGSPAQLLAALGTAPFPSHPNAGNSFFSRPQQAREGPAAPLGSLGQLWAALGAGSCPGKTRTRPLRMRVRARSGRSSGVFRLGGLSSLWAPGVPWGVDPFAPFPARSRAGTERLNPGF